MCVYWLILQRIRTPLIQSEFRVKTVVFIIGSFVSSFTKSVKLSLYKPPPEIHPFTGRCSLWARALHIHTRTRFIWHIQAERNSSLPPWLEIWESSRRVWQHRIWGDTHMFDRFISFVGFLSTAYNGCKAVGSATSQEWRRVRRIYSLTGHRVSKTNLSFGRLDNNRIYPRQPLSLLFIPVGHCFAANSVYRHFYYAVLTDAFLSVSV